MTWIFYDLLSTKRSNIKRSRLEFGQNPVGSLQSALQSSQGSDLACRKKGNQTELQQQNKLSALLVKNDFHVLNVFATGVTWNSSLSIDSSENILYHAIMLGCCGYKFRDSSGKQKLKAVRKFILSI